jgi:hypothetical protein
MRWNYKKEEEMFIIIASVKSLQIGFFGPYEGVVATKGAMRSLRKEFEESGRTGVNLKMVELKTKVADLD